MIKHYNISLWKNNNNGGISFIYYDCNKKILAYTVINDSKYITLYLDKIFDEIEKEILNSIINQLNITIKGKRSMCLEIDHSMIQGSDLL